MFFRNNNENSQNGVWLQYEMLRKREILEAFWHKRILKYNLKSVDAFKNMIVVTHFPRDQAWNHNINLLFNNAISNKITFETFFTELKPLPFDLVMAMNAEENLIDQQNDDNPDSPPEITDGDILNLRQYLIQKNISASVTIGNAADNLISPNFPENHTAATFAMHSVGKVFIAMLVFILIREGVLHEKALDEIIQLDQSVLRALPVTVSDQLRKVTLHQLMTHKAGLGDYLDIYCDAIAQGKRSEIKRIEDFLPFVESNVFAIGEERYSNAGFLLVGCAIQHAYAKKFGPCDYHDILRQHILDPAKLSSFSHCKPANGAFNQDDNVAPHIAGSPAGGYWITSEDLAKFGQWLYIKCVADEQLKLLLEKYGQEFYDTERQTIAHSGGIPSSSAYFSVSLKSGALLAVFSDQPRMAFDLRLMIQSKIFSKPKNAWEWGRSIEPAATSVNYYLNRGPAKAIIRLPVVDIKLT